MVYLFIYSFILVSNNFLKISLRSYKTIFQFVIFEKTA